MHKWIFKNEINRCLLCYDPECDKACDKNVRPAEKIRSQYFDNRYKAVDSLDFSLCQNCDGKCEKACILSKTDHPIRIRDILEYTDELRDTFELSDFEPDLSTDICGVKLENPFLLSSSVVASSYEMCKSAFEAGWAGVCFKTICNFPQHETSPRFSALKSRTGTFYGFKNIEQLSNHAIEDDMAIFSRLKAEYPHKVIIASIMGRGDAEWCDLARRADEAGADIIELNFSCPHIEDNHLGKTIGQSRELCERFATAARMGTNKPILAKMTPNVAEMEPYAIASVNGGADGIAAINTIMSVTGINVETLSPEPSIRGNSTPGGYSGKAVKPIALRFISDLSNCKELKGVHISAMGGIETWRDALEFLLLGAGSLQVTTAVMQYGYRIIDDLIDGLKCYMRARNIHDLRPLINASITRMVEYNELERDTILYPRFHFDTCIGCGRCYISCLDGGHQAIEFDEKERRPKLIGKKCVGCHLCRLVCPCGSIGISDRRVNKI